MSDSSSIVKSWKDLLTIWYGVQEKELRNTPHFWNGHYQDREDCRRFMRNIKNLILDILSSSNGDFIILSIQ